MGKELGANATTIDSFVLGYKTQNPNRVALTSGDVIFLDEAGMVGTALWSVPCGMITSSPPLVPAALRYLKNTVGAVHLEDLHRFRNADGSPNNAEAAANRGKDFVKNNDVWTVAEIHADGSLTAKHQGHAGTITLPAQYVRENTMLGYAATIHRTRA